MFCTNCGSKLPEGARFCSTCGARVAETFEVPEVEEKPASLGFAAKAPDPETVRPVEEPLKKRVTFDWSNVIDEPQKKTIPDIKSPWATTGGIDEKQLYAEMGSSSERSRTMSFIDVLKAEKEQQETVKAEEPAAPEPAREVPAAEEKRPFEYTEILDPGFLEPAPEAPVEEKKEEEVPQLHFAPLYEDIDAPVVTPFDIPEEEEKVAAPADEVQIAETVQAEEPAEEAAETEEVPAAPAAPVEEPAAEIHIEETVVEEAAPEAPAEEAAEAEEMPEVPAAPAEEPAAELNIEAPVEEPVKPRRGWFDLPDFLKPKEERRPFASITEEEPEEIPAVRAEEPEAPAAPVEEPEAPVEDAVFEEPEFEYSDAAEPAEEIQIEAAEYEPEINLEDELDNILKGGSGLKGHEPEESEAEEIKAEADAEIFEEDLYNNTEDEYLDITTERSAEPVRGAADEAEADDADEDEPVDETELFAEMTESAPKHTGMTIAPPADKETEIEALKKRLAELMGTSWEPETAAEPAAEEPAPEAPAEEHVEQDYYFKDPEPAAEPAEEAPAYEEYDHADFAQYEAPVSTAAYEDEYLKAEPAEEAPASEPEVEEAPAVAEEPADIYSHLILTPEEPVDAIPGAEDKIIQAAVAAAPAVAEEPAEEVVAAKHAAEDVAEEVSAESEAVEAPAAAEPSVEDFYLMDEQPEEEEIIFRAHRAAEEEPVVIEAPEAPAVEEPVVFEAPEAPAVEEPVVIEAPEAPAAEEPAKEPAPKTIDDFLADILREGAAPAEEAAPAAEPAAVFEAPKAPAVEEPIVFESPEAPAAEEPVVFEAPEAPAAEEPVVIEAPEAPAVEESAAEAPALTLEDLVPAAEPVAEEVSAAVNTEEDNTDEVVLTAEDLKIPAAEEAAEVAEAPALTLEDLIPAAQPAVPEVPAAEETVAPVVEEAAAEAPAPEKKETDALSIEELEQDLFGAASAPEAEVEATKKIDKFYTLYRKNEEFQRLLDEEYNKLKAAGGPTPEPAIPDSEPKEVKHKKIEDATIYQDFDLEKEAARLRAEQEKAAGSTAEAKTVVENAAPAAAVAAAGAAGAAVAGKVAEKADPQQFEYDEVEKGGGCLTVLAVVIAILLIILLGVILVLNFMPDSSLALRIDSIIENITSHFTAVDVMGKTLLL